MIYTPGAYDALVPSHSRELVREAFKALRASEHIVRAQRARDSFAKTESVAQAGHGEGDPARS